LDVSPIIILSRLPINHCKFNETLDSCSI